MATGKAALLVGGILSATWVARASPPPSEYERKIQPIFTNNCIACHQAGQAPDGLVLEEHRSFAQLVGRRSVHAPLPLVTPGHPDRSYLLAKLEGTHLQAKGQGERMPLGGALSATDLAAIRLWISNGARP